MKVEFNIECMGWMDCKIIEEKKDLSICHNVDYGDDFYNLISTISILIDTQFDRDWYGHERIVTWSDDIFDFEWKIVRFEDFIEIKIYKYIHDTKDFLGEVFSCRTNLSKLVSAFYHGLKGLYDFHGLLGFKASWESYNFPLYEFLQFKSFILNEKLPLEFIYGDMGVMKSSKLLELELLQREL